MKITKEQEEMIINMGAFDYDIEKIASILGFETTELKAELKKKDSELTSLIKKGVDMSDYVIDLKLFEMAKVGDLKALEKFESRQRQRERKRKK